MTDPSDKLDQAFRHLDNGDTAAADRICGDILQAEPQYHAALYLRGLIAFQQGRRDDAVDFLRRAEALAPSDGSLKRTLATILLEAGDFAGAAERYAALEAGGAAFGASDALNLTRLGEGLRQMGRLSEAAAWFERAYRIEPKSPAAAGLFVCAQLACDWRHIDEYERVLDALTEEALAAGRVPVEDPFVHITRVIDPARNGAVARAWSRRWPAAAAPTAARGTFREDPIRLGYLSSDFHEHATAYLMGDLFALHDRARFEVYAYSCGPDDGSEIRRHLETSCDVFRDFETVSAEDAAGLIASDGIDILIDLKGPTRKNRLDIAARRPVPLQATYLGFPGTSGANFFDYVIADPVVLPQQDWPHYSETPLLLPHSYQINCRREHDTAIERAAAGLPEDAFVFCAFTNSYKIEPVMFARWMAILDAVPESVLWLCPNNALAEANLRREAEARGIAGKRLIFAPFVPQDTHIARLSLADLALDTRIYNGHTTTSDALWAGVPVVTVTGGHFASRVSESILRAAGLADLVATDLDAFVALAVSLAEDRAARDAVRAKIAEARTAAPLFDARRFVADLERGLTEIWTQWRNGAPRRPVQVEAA